MDIQRVPKAGPVFPKTFSRVVFRINGEKELRVFDPRNLPEIYRKLSGTDIEYSTLQFWCQKFVELRCRPFMISPNCGRTWKSLGKPEVDHFYCDHPEVK
jgi:hypothetical protein